MELYLDIYETADKGIASNVVLDDQTVLEIQKKVKDAGYPIATMVTYSNMENYESVDSFLKECMEGKRGSVVIYEIHNDGGLGRMKFIFDGTDMYVVSTRGIWNADNKPEFRTFLIRDSKNGNTRKKDGSAMSCVCQSRQRLVKLWMEAA